MMRGTPRTFVGSVAFLLDGAVPHRVAERVRAELVGVPGVDRCDLDLAAGTLVVTATAPADRAEVVSLLDRLGCPVRA